MNEFLIFKPGVNKTLKGDFLFDSIAAASVMAAFETHGADVMIDLEHLSLDTESPAFDPDARGWCKLAVKPDGSLWAVDVRWTTDGARRLAEKTQRYISPAFFTDEEGRVQDLLNIALVAMPATHKLPALVAANKRRPAAQVATLSIDTYKVSNMLLTAILKKLGLAEDASPEDTLAALDALMAPKEEKPSEEAPPEEPKTEEEELKALSRLHPNHQAKILSYKAKCERAEKSAEDAERSALIAANTDVITPALEKWAKTISLSALKEFCSNVAHSAKPATEPEKAPVADPFALSPELENAIKVCGVDRAAVIKFKQGNK